jgi:hypothetical protein
VFVQDFLQHGCGLLPAAEGQALAGMIPISIELFLDDCDAGATLQQSPDHVEIIDAGKISQRFVRAANLQEFALTEKKEMLKVARPALQGFATEEFLAARRVA